MTWQSWSCFWQCKWVSLWVPQALDSAWCDSAWGPDPCVDPCDPSLSDGDNKSDTLSLQICGFRVSRVWKNSAENGFCLWWFGNPFPWLDFCLCFASWCTAAVVKSLGHLSSPQIQRPDGLSWLLFQVTVCNFLFLHLSQTTSCKPNRSYFLSLFFVFDWYIWLWICCLLLSLQTENATSFVCFHILLHNSYNFRSLLYHTKNYINTL